MTGADTDQARLTTDEIHLLREVARWCHHMGVSYDARNMEWTDPHGPSVYLLTRDTECDIPTALGVRRKADGERSWYDAESVAEAVDILVAIGFLPSRFSSCYRDGWEASAVWHDAEGQEAEYRRRFHDPDNISFPVGGEWQ